MKRYPICKCGREIRDVRMDGPPFHSCAVCRRDNADRSRRSRQGRDDRYGYQNVLTMESVVTCVKCGAKMTLREMALGVNGQPPHRSEHTW